MTVKEIVAQAERLPLNERWQVVSELLRSLQSETLAAVADKKQPAGQADDEFSAVRMRGILKPVGPIPTDEEIKEGESAEARQRRLASIPPLRAVLGILKPEGHIPTDEEIKEDYTNYSIRKYS